MKSNLERRFPSLGLDERYVSLSISNFLDPRLKGVYLNSDEFRRILTKKIMESNPEVEDVSTPEDTDHSLRTPKHESDEGK